MNKSRNTYFLLAIAAILFIFGYFPNAVENIYSRSLYPIISGLLRLISGIFPFAIGDFLYALLIGIVGFNIIKFSLKNGKTKNNYINFFFGSLNVLLVVYIAFKLLWGLNYSRPRINETLKISNKPYKKEQLFALNHFLLAQIKTSGYNAISATNINFTVTELRNIAAKSLTNLGASNTLFRYKFNNLKPTFNGWLTSKMGIEGYYNPLSGEANMNMLMPNHVLPYVACHEIAHQLGFAKEDEANFVGYLIAMKSENTQFKYAAYYSMLKYVLLEIRINYPEDFEKEFSKVPETVKMHFNDERIFWSKYNGKMSDYMSMAFDQILKLNSQKKGIKSYQEIVLWLVNYHKKEINILNQIQR